MLVGPSLHPLGLATSLAPPFHHGTFCPSSLERREFDYFLLFSPRHTLSYCSFGRFQEPIIDLFLHYFPPDVDFLPPSFPPVQRQVLVVGLSPRCRDEIGRRMLYSYLEPEYPASSVAPSGPGLDRYVFSHANRDGFFVRVGVAPTFRPSRGSRCSAWRRGAFQTSAYPCRRRRLKILSRCFCIRCFESLFFPRAGLPFPPHHSLGLAGFRRPRRVSSGHDLCTDEIVWALPGL